MEMTRLSLEELKSCQIGILDAVAAFCDQNGINYYLSGGTLLGAVRHQGYIPWDDDIDICMMREDYDRFLREFNRSGDRYQVFSIENDSDFLREYGKVLDTSTVLYEPDEKGKKLCVNIDLFVLDAAPEDDELVKELYDRRDRLRRKNILREQSKHQKVTGFHSLYYFIRGLFRRAVPERYYVEQLVLNARRYEDPRSEFVGDFCGYYYGQPRVKVKRALFSESALLLFEGKLYKAPGGYDEWLTALYGDYMTLPPKDKRVSHHRFVAYKIGNET